MASPKSKISRSKRGMRRAHNALKSPTTHNCQNCGSLVRPHTACGSCGYYKGKEVLFAN